MELFSEIHSRYFYIIRETLKMASMRRLSGKDIATLVERLGFAETSLSLTPQLINAGLDGYFLLKKEPTGYASLLKGEPQIMLTEMQKRWIKAILTDKRFTLFFNEGELKEFATLFSEIRPLYDNDHLVTIDKASDGDDYFSDQYRMIFKTVMGAIQEKKIVLITYESGKGNRLSAYFAPYKLEYSIKDDKFRLCAVRMLRGKMQRFYKLNLSRITSVQIVDRRLPAKLAEHVKSGRMPLPVEIEITNERNGFERIFTQLSNFERVSEYDESTNKCLMKIFYYPVDEMELLITLLSFGPVIKVVGPESFKEKFVARILGQKQLLDSDEVPLQNAE